MAGHRFVPGAVTPVVSLLAAGPHPWLPPCGHLSDLRKARVQWLRRMVAASLPSDFPAAAALRTVWRCVDAWHAPTRDAYLAHLQEFVDWFRDRSLLWPRDGLISEGQLDLYVDFLLSRRSARAARCQLSVASVKNKLSALTVCFQVARLPPLQWSAQARRQLAGELTARR